MRASLPGLGPRLEAKEGVLGLDGALNLQTTLQIDLTGSQHPDLPQGTPVALDDSNGSSHSLCHGHDHVSAKDNSHATSHS